VEEDDKFLELAKGARVAPGAALMTAGMYGGQYAKLFPDPYIDLAVSGCLAALWLGIFLVGLLGVTQLIDWARK
jgi:hypothetical protein